MTDTSMIYEAWMGLRGRGLHALELANRLEIPECQMLASALGREGGPGVRRLDGDWQKLVARLPALGHVKAITRNANSVIEVEGSYADVEFFGPVMGQSLGTVDLRLFMNRWKHGYAVWEETKRGVSRSLQFFDATGRAIHKLYLRPESDEAAYESIATDFLAADQTAPGAFAAPDAPEPVKPDREVDVEAFRADWRALKDTHEFFMVLRKHGLARTQALRLGGDEFTTKVPLTAPDSLLRIAADRGVPLMCFVGNRGVIQIYSGPVKRVIAKDAWLNVLDPGFDLHMRQDRIAEAWIVRKPTVDGIVTSLEVYAADGEQMALFVGKRKPGMAESLGWRDVLAALT